MVKRGEGLGFIAQDGGCPTYSPTTRGSLSLRKPTDHDATGVPDQVRTFAGGNDLLEAGIGEHLPDAIRCG